MTGFLQTTDLSTGAVVVDLEWPSLLLQLLQSCSFNIWDIIARMSNLPTNMGYHTWAVILGADKNGPGKKVQVKTVRRKKTVLSLLLCVVIKVHLTRYHWRTIDHNESCEDVIYAVSLNDEDAENYSRLDTTFVQTES